MIGCCCLKDVDALKHKEPELMMVTQAKELMAEVINGFFDLYKNLLATNGLHNQLHCILNLDEMNLNTDRQGEIVFIIKQTKD